MKKYIVSGSCDIQMILKESCALCGVEGERIKTTSYDVSADKPYDNDDRLSLNYSNPRNARTEFVCKNCLYESRSYE